MEDGFCGLGVGGGSGRLVEIGESDLMQVSEVMAPRSAVVRCVSYVVHLAIDVCLAWLVFRAACLFHGFLRSGCRGVVE